MASDRPMPASAPAVARSPAQTALPMTALTTGTAGRKKPIAMQASEVRRRKAAFATTLIAPRLPAAARRLAYQRSVKATIDAAIRMHGLLLSLLRERRVAHGMHGANAIEAGLASIRVRRSMAGRS